MKKSSLKLKLKKKNKKQEALLTEKKGRESNRNLSIFIGTFTAGLFGMVWALFNLAFSSGSSMLWVGFAVSFFLAYILFSLFVVIVHRSWVFYSVIFLSTTPVILLGFNRWREALLLWGIAFLMISIAIIRIKIEQKNRINFDIMLLLKRGMPLIGTAFSLLIASCFYFAVIQKQNTGWMPNFEFQLSKKNTLAVLQAVNYLMPKEELTWVLEGITVDEYLKKTSGLKSLLPQGWDAGVLGEELKTEIETWAASNHQRSLEKVAEDSQKDPRQVEELSAELGRKVLGKQLGMKLSGQERMDDLMYQAINNKLKELFSIDIIITQVLPFGIALAVFLMARSILWIFRVLFSWSVSLAFSFLVRFSILKTKKELKEVDVIL